MIIILDNILDKIRDLGFSTKIIPIYSKNKFLK